MIPITYQERGPPAPLRPVVYEWHYEPPRSRFVLSNGSRHDVLGTMVPCCGIAMMTVRECERTLPRVICAYGVDKPVEGPDDVVHILNLAGNYFNGADGYGYQPLIPGQVCMGNAALRAVDRDDVVNAFWNSPVYWSAGRGIAYASRTLAAAVLPATSLPAMRVMLPIPTHRHWDVVSVY